MYRLTSIEKHHFFGFHDLCISNNQGDKLLALQVDEIDHPPRKNQQATIGFVDIESKRYISIGQTSAWNFPQGARQQWLGDTNKFIVNDMVNNAWGSCLYDSETQEIIEKYDTPTHVVNSKLNLSFSINYSRLHRLGGYGYTGLVDNYAEDSAPSKDGIFKLNLETKKVELLISIKTVSEFGVLTPSRRHHYITHLSLSPNGDRLAFLHRYRLNDGGEMTRLMTIGIDGSNLRCLIYGYLSHYDWKDDNSILIWGRSNQTVANLRENFLLKRVFSSKLMKNLKPAVRRLLKQSKAMDMSFNLVKDSNEFSIKKIAENIITSDGHPMVNPLNRDVMICDTYPNSDGIRTLMLYRFSTNTRVDLGDYKMINDKPSDGVVKEFSTSIDPIIRDVFNAKEYSFARSGLHCDLHPRWLANGKSIAFDSIHEGTRQIYIENVENYI
jgi:hypothetical protein